MLLGVCLSGSLHAQTPFKCSGSNEDMMTYFLMGYPDRIDNYMASPNVNPIYSSITPDIGPGYAQQGYFVWTKGRVRLSLGRKNFRQEPHLRPVHRTGVDGSDYFQALYQGPAAISQVHFAKWRQRNH